MCIAVLPSAVSDRGVSCQPAARPRCSCGAACRIACRCGGPGIGVLVVCLTYVCLCRARLPCVGILLVTVLWHLSLTVGCYRSQRRGWCGVFALHEALCRCVAGVSHPLVVQFPRRGTCLKGAVPTTQTTSPATAHFQRYSPNGSAVWPPRRPMPRSHQHRSGGSAPLGVRHAGDTPTVSSSCHKTPTTNDKATT